MLKAIRDYFRTARPETANLIAARRLADEVAKLRGHTVYVVWLCDDDYEVTAWVPDHYEYKASP